MLYAVAKKARYDGKIEKLTVIDTNTGSKCKLCIVDIKRMCKKHLNIIRNVIVDTENKVLIKSWPNEIPTLEDWDLKPNNNHKYTLLYGACHDEFKLVTNEGRFINANIETVKALTIANEITNCKFNNQSKIIEFMDVNFIQKDQAYIDKINEQYERSVSKLSVIGYGNCSFKYKVLGNKVTLSQYTGTSKNVIIPDFVNYIYKDAFLNKKLNSLVLGKNIEGIGEQAFMNCELKSVKIPKSTKIIGTSAFYSEGGSSMTMGYDTDLKLMNKNIVNLNAGYYSRNK